MVCHESKFRRRARPEFSFSCHGARFETRQPDAVTFDRFAVFLLDFRLKIVETVPKSLEFG
jgi:hypothetical protein